MSNPNSKLDVNPQLGSGLGLGLGLGLSSGLGLGLRLDPVLGSTISHKMKYQPLELTAADHADFVFTKGQKFSKVQAR